MIRPLRLLSICALAIAIGVTVGIGSGCNTGAKQPSGEEAPPDPEAIALHAKLFAAAEQGDTGAFRALLTPRSIELLDRFFRAARELDAPPGVRVSWEALLAHHAELPPAARARAPYPVVEGKLDLGGHADAGFFEAAGEAAGKLKEGLAEAER